MQHSNTASRLRRHCAMLFGVSDNDMLHTETRREKFCSRIGWVLNENGHGSYSSADVEILHKNYSGSYNINTVFLNPILMRVREVFSLLLQIKTDWVLLLSGILCYYPWSLVCQGNDDRCCIQSQEWNHGPQASYSKYYAGCNRCNSNICML